MLDPEGRWIVRSHIGWGGERSIRYKGVETSRFKTVRMTAIRNEPKRTISTSGGFELLHWIEYHTNG